MSWGWHTTRTPRRCCRWNQRRSIWSYLWCHDWSLSDCPIGSDARQRYERSVSTTLDIHAKVWDYLRRETSQMTICSIVIISPTTLLTMRQRQEFRRWEVHHDKWEKRRLSGRCLCRRSLINVDDDRLFLHWRMSFKAKHFLSSARNANHRSNGEENGLSSTYRVRLFDNRIERELNTSPHVARWTHSTPLPSWSEEYFENEEDEPQVPQQDLRQRRQWWRRRRTDGHFSPQKGPKTTSGMVESIVLTSICGANEMEQFESLTWRLTFNHLEIW